MSDTISQIDVKVSGPTKSGKTLIMAKVKRVLEESKVRVVLSAGENQPSGLDLDKVLQSEKDIIETCSPLVVLEEKSPSWLNKILGRYGMLPLEEGLNPLLAFHLSLMEKRYGMSWGKEHKETNPEGWLRDTATIKFDLGKRNGKTTFIAHSAQAEDVIICHSPDNVRIMQYYCEKAYTPGGSRTYLPDQCESIEGDIVDVWIDDASILPKAVLDSLYTALANRCRRFILVG